jgi:ribosomal protein S18 acetylase RimI-like enzyme
MSLVLRDAVAPDDADRLAALVRACGNFDPHEVDYVPEILSALSAEGEASGYRLLVAETADEPAGFAIFGPTDADEGAFDLYWIATDPRVRRQGAARMLLGERERRAKAEGARRMSIETEGGEAYAAAHALYRAHGYAPVETTADHYGPGRARVIFAKALG